MYIRDMIPRNSMELAEAVPIDTAMLHHLGCLSVSLNNCQLWCSVAGIGVHLNPFPRLRSTFLNYLCK